ncbi:HxlR family transcriptional regulator [Kribbella orskensis]|uniref:HxlR family transcriptional regulator n=1 Tax=Kribbella orskensis TaxID=2512216 RepID=A0ABY2BV05_9ACTN|nr:MULTISPECIES: helix-turn-helix domain-containing protein [Kribbella]TCN44358.1 HxlR family transcriptional regulator [Kribbella sp. VKM Ac-2500]TCO31864.1 HxlR family transcriptional regulator [Kribbella orskensis]
MPKSLGKDSTCSIARSLEVLGDRWTLLILREALIEGSTRFQEFREALGVAPNLLAQRLTFLIEEGLLTRRTYQTAGTRARDEYVLTEAGRSLNLVIAALSDWGRTCRPRSDGTSPSFAVEDSGTLVRLAFVTEDGDQVDAEQLVARRASDRELVGR